MIKKWILSIPTGPSARWWCQCPSDRWKRAQCRCSFLTRWSGARGRCPRRIWAAQITTPCLLMSQCLFQSPFPPRGDWPDLTCPREPLVEGHAELRLPNNWEEFIHKPERGDPSVKSKPAFPLDSNFHLLEQSPLRAALGGSLKLQRLHWLSETQLPSSYRLWPRPFWQKETYSLLINFTFRYLHLQRFQHSFAPSPRLAGEKKTV